MCLSFAAFGLRDRPGGVDRADVPERLCDVAQELAGRLGQQPVTDGGPGRDRAWTPWRGNGLAAPVSNSATSRRGSAGSVVFQLGTRL